jgi:putative DNA primase/helicase
LREEGIPASVRPLRRFVAWKLEHKDGRWTKVPYVATATNSHASSTDSRTWRSSVEAIGAVNGGKADGLGLVLGPNGQPSIGDLVAALDFDHCVDADGTIRADVREYIARINSYTERSPTDGIRILALADGLPPGRRKRGDTEMYNTGRYVTLTGHHVAGTPTDLQDRTAEIAALHAEIFGPAQHEGHDDTVPAWVTEDDAAGTETIGPEDLPAPVTNISDDDLLALARAAANGDKFAALWAGDISGYPSHSEADSALCMMLAFWSQWDADRIDRLFRRSGLMRQKWERADYRTRTIARAVDLTGTTVYAPSDRPVVTDDAPGEAGGADTTTGGTVKATEFPLTEAGDAECFARLYRDGVRYDHRQGRWLLSDPTSGTWIPDPVERLTQMAVRTARKRQQDANKIADTGKREAAWKWAFKGEGRGRITNTLALARSVLPIADPGDDWDGNPFLLGTPNGVVDLETGTFRKATAADRVTMRVRVAYDPTATCPLWLSTLADIFAPPEGTDLIDLEEQHNESQRVIDFVQRAAGYSITGDCREECCFFPWGEGCNGKGTFMNTLAWLFGDYTDDMPYASLEKSTRGSAIPNDIAKLVGKRFITCAEVNEFNLNEARLKALTGRDPMTARFLHKEFFTFIPVCKIWIATNNKPKILGQDDGIWRRIHLIPFLQNFQGRENKKLKDELRAELPGVLNWIIAGAGLWLRDGLNPPETVKAATAAYRQESNPITPFIEACCVVGQSMRMQASDGWKAYEEFCRNANIEPWQRLTNKAFYRAFEKAFTADRSGRQTYYIGIGLRATDRRNEAQNDAKSPRRDDYPEL